MSHLLNTSQHALHQTWNTSKVCKNFMDSQTHKQTMSHLLNTSQHALHKTWNTSKVCKNFMDSQTHKLTINAH
jgi:hypothetical protein